MTTALLCLQNRHTTEYLPGDLSYALMGLLRQRPHVRQEDSAFQASARLSLANDGNLLLERLIFLLPKNPYEGWRSLHDHWGALLWDIYPKTQICGIGENDSIILDGARAASIRLDAFKPVNLRGNETLIRTLSRIMLTVVSLLFIIELTIVSIQSICGTIGYKYKGLSAFGSILMAVSSITILLSQKLIHHMYLGTL